MGYDGLLSGSNYEVEEQQERVHLTPRLWQVGFTLAATAALLGVAVVCALTAIAKTSYSATWTAGICGVAFLHYYNILGVRLKQLKAEDNKHGNPKKPFKMKRGTNDFLVTVYRHSDWAVRAPSLCMPLHVRRQRAF